MSRYRKVETAMWHDAKFAELSAAQPNAQTVWTYLLVGPRTTTFPGLVAARAEVMASDLGWSVEAFRKAFEEVSAKGMAKADWKAGLVLLPRALLERSGEARETAKPQSPNVILNWGKSWSEIPECSLKDEYLRNLKVFVDTLGKGFVEAFLKGFRRALIASSRPDPDHPSSNQEQEQESSGPRAVPVSGSSSPVSGASGSGIAAVVPVLGVVRPDPEHGPRSALLNDSWLHLNARRRELAEEFGLEAPPRGWGIPLNATGYAESAKRIRESPSLASARVDIAHVFAVAEANVRAGDPVSLEYFTGAMFEKKSWDKKLTMTIADAARASRRGPLPAGKSAFDVIADLGNELRALAPE